MSNLMRDARLIVPAIVAAFLVSVADEALAVAKVASAGTTWANATWTPAGVPTSADTCTIKSGVNLTVTTAAVCGALTIGNGTNSNTTLTLGAGGSLSITTAGGQSGNLVLNPSNFNRSFTLAAATQTVTVAGTFTTGTAGTNVISVSTGQVNFTRAAGIAWPANGTLTITGNNAGGSANFTGLVTQAGGTIQNTTGAGTLSFNGGFSKSAGTFTTRAGETINFAGNLAVSGTALAFNATSTATFTKTATITPTAAITFGNLIINSGVNTVTLAGNVTVGTKLTFTSGTITTGANTLITTASCLTSVTRTSGYVVGNLRKTVPVGANVTCTFEIGDAAHYTPVVTTFANVTTSNTLTARTDTPDHPDTTALVSGIDPNNSVNRWWTLTPGAIAFTTYDATFNFCASAIAPCGSTDLDVGATPATFIIARKAAGAWYYPLLGTQGATSTQAKGITQAQGFGIFAVGGLLFGYNTNLGAFNAYETATAAGSLRGILQTKIAGANSSFDIVHLNGTRNALQNMTGTVANRTVRVELMDATNNSGPLDANNCRNTWTVMQTLTPNPVFPNNTSRMTVTFNQPNAWRDVRVRITYLGAGPSQIGCSTDRFAIRPNGLTVSATDKDWVTATPLARTLNNAVASGGVVHKAGQPFAVSATAYNAAATPAITTNYNGNPTVKTIACTLPAPACTTGTLTPGTWTADPGPAASGKVTTNTASYSEVGSFNLTLEDQTFANVDTADSTLLQRTIPQTAAVAVGRFVPDHFTLATGNTPQFRTFNNTCIGVRSFTYIGQPFGYVTAPQALVTAQNAAGGTTSNYSNALWKIAAAAGVKTCTTGPDTCTLVSGNVTQAYTYTTVPAATPNWDSSQVSLAAPVVAHPLNNGTGTVTSNAADVLAFLHNLTTPQASFTASITLTESVADNSENAVAGNGIINTLTPAAFGNIAFDSGSQFLYGRLKLSNAYGSELLPLPVPLVAQYWNGNAFVTNAADNCTTLVANNIKLTAPPAGVAAIVGGAFSAGVGSLILSKPTAPAKVSVDLCADLGVDPVGGTVCVATTSAGLPYLQGLWAPGSSYNNDPTARATFGVYKGNNNFIYQRENY